MNQKKREGDKKKQSEHCEAQLTHIQSGEKISIKCIIKYAYAICASINTN